MVAAIAVCERVVVDVDAPGPVRGRVAVFRAPRRPESEYVKRVVGLPGETISSNGTELRVDGTPVARCRVGTSRGRRERRRTGGRALARGARSRLAARLPLRRDAQASGWTVDRPIRRGIRASENSHDSPFCNGGKGGTLPLRFVVGAVTGVDTPVLPAGAEALAHALA